MFEQRIQRIGAIIGECRGKCSPERTWCRSEGRPVFAADARRDSHRPRVVRGRFQGRERSRQRAGGREISGLKAYEE